MKVNLWKTQQGDTIVEVLIAMAILTLVLAGAYYTANSSYRNVRDSEEHTEALTVAQGQLEELRTVGASFVSSGKQCIDNTTIQPVNTCYVAANNITNMGSSCPASANYCYLVKISPAQSPINPVPGATFNSMQINVTWQALGSSQTNSVSLFYRLDTPAP